MKGCSKHACRVLFSSFCAIGMGLKCGVHSHQVIAKSLSKQVGGNAVTQSCALQHNTNSEGVRGNASTQPYGSPAFGHNLASGLASGHNLATGLAFGYNVLVELITAFGHNELVKLIGHVAQTISYKI
jgi:hypothetical protein